MYGVVFGFGPLCVLKHDNSGDVAQLLPAVETGNLEDKEVANDLALELLHEIRSSLRRAA